MSLLAIFRDLVIESAPWLLLGYFLAGVIKQVVPGAWVEQQLAQSGLLPIIKGALIGAPIPLCSCGVIPAALAIRKAGASKGATSSFLVATPETGVDSIAYSYAMLGPVFAIARPVAALLSAVVAGVLVMLFDKEESIAPVPADCEGCCGGKGSAPPAARRFTQKMLDALQYGYGDMIADTARWLLIGLAAAAVITAVVPQAFFLQWGDGVAAMLVMVIVGLPMYICATASTPVAAGFLFAGVSPGAALVFMLTGPATNIATMGVIREHLGNRSLLAYLVGVIGSAVFCGVVLNALFARFDWNIPSAVMEQDLGYPAWRYVMAVILIGLVARVWVQPWLRRQFAGINAARSGSSG